MSKNPMHAVKGQIYFIGVLRFTDKAICAFYSTGEVDKEGFRELVAQNANAKMGVRYSAAGENQSVHYYYDNMGRVYGLVKMDKSIITIQNFILLTILLRLPLQSIPPE